METISLLDGARLEREGAARRLELAKQGLRDFLLQFPCGTTDPRLQNQWLACEAELDSANRRYMECAYQLRELEAQANARQVRS
jgi:hypothetical protein